MITRTSELTCPHCGHRSLEIMPTDVCIYFHDCAACGEVLRPKAGHCCVFCSYGSVPCPPIQANAAACHAQSEIGRNVAAPVNALRGFDRNRNNPGRAPARRKFPPSGVHSNEDAKRSVARTSARIVPRSKAE